MPIDEISSPQVLSAVGPRVDFSLVTAAAGEVIDNGGAGAARRTGASAMNEHRQPPILTGHDGGLGEYDGEALANEVFDLIRRRLPRLRPEDPMRPMMAQLLPALGEALGRPPLLPVAGRQTP